MGRGSFKRPAQCQLPSELETTSPNQKSFSICLEWKLVTEFLEWQLALQRQSHWRWAPGVRIVAEDDDTEW